MKVYVGDNSEVFLFGLVSMLLGVYGIGYEQKNKMYVKIDF